MESAVVQASSMFSGCRELAESMVDAMRLNNMVAYQEQVKLLETTRAFHLVGLAK